MPSISASFGANHAFIAAGVIGVRAATPAREELQLPRVEETRIVLVFIGDEVLPAPVAPHFLQIALEMLLNIGLPQLFVSFKKSSVLFSAFSAEFIDACCLFLQVFEYLIEVLLLCGLLLKRF